MYYPLGTFQGSVFTVSNQAARTGLNGPKV
jgi:hypothetical protein